VLVAAGGGANQGSMLLCALLLGLCAVAAGLYGARRSSTHRSIVSLAICVLALAVSGCIAYIFGLPYDWTYWGAYLPWVPLALSIWGFVLALRTKRLTNSKAV
jgi:ABC-type branched-subunit amino acid transport system permease subunit